MTALENFMLMFVSIYIAYIAVDWLKDIINWMG